MSTYLPIMQQDLLTTIRNENLSVYRSSSQRVREDIGAELQIAQDYRGRLVYELLQNADDAMQSDDEAETLEEQESGCIRFVLSDDQLWVGNSGRALTGPDVRGLCGISASSKSQVVDKRRASIGHKGMGFKSVLEITDAPEVYSDTYSFYFSPPDALEAVQELVREGIIPPTSRAPVTRFPWPARSDDPTWLAMKADGLKTGFCFPLKPAITPDQRALLVTTLQTLPVTALVFLKHIRRVEITIHQGDVHTSLGWSVDREYFDNDHWCAVRSFSQQGLYRVSLKADADVPESFLVAFNGDIRIGDHRGGIDDFTWDGVDYTEVSVAAQIEDDRPIPLRPERRKLHVFLPTGEACPYPLLISGAFSSNLSRQEIRVEQDPAHYNRFLLGESAHLARKVLFPFLLRTGSSATDILCLLDRSPEGGMPNVSPAAQTIHDYMRQALHDFPFVPGADGNAMTIAECLTPPLVRREEAGQHFRSMLAQDANLAGKKLPHADVCRREPSRVLADLGAATLTPTQAAQLLAQADPDLTRLRKHQAGKYDIDPVLEVLEEFWVGLTISGQSEFTRAIRAEPLFPVSLGKDNTVNRIVTENLVCFYPPRSLRGEVPLSSLCFLLQEICWGALARTERNRTLQGKMALWNNLFDIKEFKFADVMRASILPALELDSDEESRTVRSSFHSLEHLAAICQLAGRTPKRNEPLPYERLGTNRALFNLSRLDVPCRGANGQGPKWVPAYRAYLGDDWVGQASVEWIFLAAEQIGVKELPEIDYLVPPNELKDWLGLLEHMVEDTLEEKVGETQAEDEVNVDEDDEATLDSDEHTRWLDFFLWLGVNRSMRVVHFHDVEERSSGWITTAELVRPQGHAFQTLRNATWSEYVRYVRAALQRSDPARHAATTPFFFQMHSLEHLGLLLQHAPQNKTVELGHALYEHLARNWEYLERFERLQTAQVPLGQQPGRRKSPAKPNDDEVKKPCENFWLFLLKQSPFCPSGHGPRLARDLWLPTQEVARRFGRKTATQTLFLVPTLSVDEVLLHGKARGLIQALGIREELTPARFTAVDALQLLNHLKVQFDQVWLKENWLAELRTSIRPAYRNLLELLSSRERTDEDGDGQSIPLSTAPFLVHDGRGHYQFVEASAAHYFERRDTRERLDADLQVWSFVLEATPGARAPLVNLFGIRILEDDLHWVACPGDPALTEGNMTGFQEGLRELAPFLLARIEANRESEALISQDMRRMRTFLEHVLPVTHLELRYRLTGAETPTHARSREAFADVSDEKQPQAFVVWGEHPWPPSPNDAEALATALCDVFGRAYFEPFLALAQEPTPDGRTRLLRRAGAPVDVAEKQVRFAATAKETASEELHDIEPIRSTAFVEDEDEEMEQKRATGESHQVRRTRLFEPADLLVDGEAVIVQGMEHGPPPAQNAKHYQKRTPATNGTGYGGYTDLEALNELGMIVALAFERNRLRKSGMVDAAVFDSSNPLPQPEALIFDVSTPERIALARAGSRIADEALESIAAQSGVSPEWPGFDILSLDQRSPLLFDRLIELKSSGVQSRSQELSWNEWRAASSDCLAESYYLYLVGNLRADLNGVLPFVRTLRNPLSQLVADVQENQVTRRKIALATHLFREAEHLELTVQEQDMTSSTPSAGEGTGTTPSTT